MPRGVKIVKDYDVQLQEIDEKVARYQELIKDLSQKRTEVLKKKEESDIQKLYQYMNENGMSVSQVLTVLAASSETKAKLI